MAGRLKGKKALITGASSGIGAGVAVAFAKEGADVVINFPNKQQEAGAKKVASAVRKAGGKAYLVQADVSKEGPVRRLVKESLKRLGQIDILVNNAGMQHRNALQDFPPEAFEKLLQTNIASVFHVGQAVARHMIRRERGKIINIASVQSALARPGIAPYTATKGAVTNLTKGMATDWAKHGLQCNAIAPGYIATNNTAALRADTARGYFRRCRLSVHASCQLRSWYNFKC